MNAVFPAVAGIATNFNAGCARLCLSRAAMTLWRFGRDVLDLPARIPRREGGVLVHLFGARERLCREPDIGFAKPAAL